MKGDLVIFRGGGDVGTGAVQKLHRAGFRVLILERAFPLCVRRTVSCAEAMFNGRFQIEDFTVVRCEEEYDIRLAWENDEIPIIEDEKGVWITRLKPLAVVDVMIAKKNIGTHRAMAPITVALGPGFKAGVDCDIVVETNRGHDLARLIFHGEAAPNTGNPGNIEGYTVERVLRAPCDGRIRTVHDIGDVVKKDDILAYVDDRPIKTVLSGMVRGMIRDGATVVKGQKIGDVDPRIQPQNAYTISDKARAIGGAVLEAVLLLKRERYL